MLRYNWQRELAQFAPQLKTEIITSSKQKVDALEKNVSIVSYELASKVITTISDTIAIVLDECQQIKNCKAKRTQAIHKIVFNLKPSYFIALSGTPIKNHAGEFFSILKLCSYNPVETNGLRVVEKNQLEFSRKFCYSERQRIAGGRFIEKYYGVRNVDELKLYLKGKYIRRTSKSVLNLPELIFKSVDLNIKRPKVSDRDLKEAYEQYQRHATAGEHLTQIKADNALQKAIYTISYSLNLIDQDESVVIFTDHINSLKAIVLGLRKKGISTGFIRGGLKDVDKQAAVDRFQERIDKAIVCTYGSASVGFTLTAAKNMVLNDLSWVPADVDQARKRIHRIGQKSMCVVHTMFAGNIDRQISQAVLQKTNTLRAIL